MAYKKGNPNKEITSTRHKDKRANIPTKELEGFVRDEEISPKKILYPRDTSLDPQLVWKGKDEQDSKDLEVPAVPVYIQEKIHPQAIIEDIRAQAKKDRPEEQTNLFGDFNGIAFEQMIDFYHHEQNWANRLILGDSLLVMTSLAEKEGLKGKVQMIYIDPPYGIKFGSNWQVSTRKRDVKDGKAEDATRQPEQIKAFRDTWKLGIHSYLAYLRDRLTIARELLTETGSIFVQIGDENVHLVRNLLDEVFGYENFVSIISVRKTTSEGSTLIGSTCDFLICYGKNREHTKFKVIYQIRSEGAESRYDQNGPDSRNYRLDNITSSRPAGEGDVRSYTWNGQTFDPGKGTFKTTEIGLKRLFIAERMQVTGKGKLNYKRFQDDFGYAAIANLWTDISGAVQSRSDPKIYVVQTSTPMIERCMLMTTDPGDLVLDPTCGSGTTAYVAEQWGRRWITIDTSRVALALARTRLMSARYPYFILSDSREGLEKEAESTGKIPPSYKTENDIKRGFVYKRVPHITLKSIANNPEIDVIHEKYQAKLEPIREELNKLLKQTRHGGQAWEEWEIPREPTTAGKAEDKWPAKAKESLKKWWELRRERQSEMDASISRNADIELLYDQPYEDNKRVRVSGPFTVESLSPHRMLSADEERPRSEIEGKKSDVNGQYELRIIENLRKAGVQNTRAKERLKFDTLDAYAGTWLHAKGEYSDKDGKTRRVAASIGPEHGTVGTEWIKDAAKEAVKGIAFDLLLVCGFAFEAHVDEETKEYGKLQVLPVRMNPDLWMDDDLLKKTGAGNLFMVFGEPDLKVAKKNGQITVEIKGVDIYDPTTGEIRSSKTDDIACWFIDTDYNGESFFVRHAYFTGADQPYEKLKKSLKAEIVESAWSSLYSTVSRPFDKPKTGKIAVKVINHYGDEVLKVYEVK